VPLDSERIVAYAKQDFFYICVGHLKDKSFCLPDASEAAALAERKKKEEMDREIEAVKREYEEKQKRKAEKRKAKEKSKDKAKDAEETQKDDDEDKKDEKERDDRVTSRFLRRLLSAKHALDYSNIKR